MAIVLLIILCLVLYKAQIEKDSASNGFLAKYRTDAIKGFFIIVVFISHIKGYYEMVGANLSAWYDAAFFLPAKVFGQLMVVMFLFFSGYGVAESIKKKGDSYIRAIPKKRILGTLVNFDVAVLIFAVVCLLLGTEVSLQNFLLSLIGWSEMGNSNWYIFSIVMCYVFTFIAYSVNKTQGGAFLWIFLFAYTFLMSVFKGTWWYNTIFAYGAGLFFSEHKEWFLYQWRHHYNSWLTIVSAGFMACLGCYLLFYGPFKSNMEYAGAMVFNVMSVFFAYLVVLLSMKITIHNKFLEWLGVNLFPLYIYQRLSMMVLSTLYPIELVANHPYVFLVICVLITGCIAWAYKFIRISL